MHGRRDEGVQRKYTDNIKKYKIYHQSVQLHLLKVIIRLLESNTAGANELSFH